MKRKKLGEVLRERGQISPGDLIQGLEDQQGRLIHLGELLLQRGLVSRQGLAGALTEVTRIPYAECENLRTDPAALKLVPHALARRCCALPVEMVGTTRLVAVMAEPQNLQLIDELRFATGLEIIPRLAFRDEIEQAIEGQYAAANQQQSAGTGAIARPEGPGMEFLSARSLERNVEAMREMQADLLEKCTPEVRLVASMITTAANKQASDIHIEPQAADTVVRLRVDGILRDYQRIPRSLQHSVTSRIKILSDMDIAERKAPQKGRFLVKIAERKIDLRVSTLPTQHGEKVVIRLLEPSAPPQDFASLGLPATISEALEGMLTLPRGMILVTGPTGSGKSTTLYSALHLVRKPSINIVTVEDPVEYLVPGLNQVQVNPKGGLSFASCLRSVLRQDPNVIMVGEIRDKETLQIALHAAEADQLVLSSLHTNDSAAAIARLLDLGGTGPQIATCVSGILAQRLIRRLCECRRVIAASPEYVSRLKGAGITKLPEMESAPVGCETCDLTGYKGRIGIYELLELDESIRSAIRSGIRSDELRLLAKQNGMKTMQEYALDRVREGLTTLEEVQRVIPFEPLAVKRCVGCAGEISPAFLFCPFCGEKVREEPVRRPRKASLIPQGARKQ